MTTDRIPLGDLARPVDQVARALPEWSRGDPADAALVTLGASASALHRRAGTLWAWTAHDDEGGPLALLPVRAEACAAFSPAAPARALSWALAAAAAAGAAPQGLRPMAWRGMTALRAPGMEAELLGPALEEVADGRVRVSVAPLPATIADASPLALRPPQEGRGDGVAALARALGVHPLAVVRTLLAHNQSVDLESYPPEMVRSLREWGCDSPAPEPEPDRPSLEIDDDPCPRRRHARTVLQRMLRMGKVGAGYHTDIAHFARGAARDARGAAFEIAEDLLRAGLLGEKPSVGQRHIYLRREALPAIHALIERGESADPELAARWTAPAPGATRARSR